MFKGKKGQALASDIGKRSKTFVPGEKIPEKKTGPSKEDIELIKVSQISMHVLSVSMSKKNSYRWQYWIDHLQSYNKNLIWQRKDKRWSSKITSRNSCLDFQIFYSVLIFFLAYVDRHFCTNSNLLHILWFCCWSNISHCYSIILSILNWVSVDFSLLIQF